MKPILSILAVVAIGAGAFFSFQTKSKFSKLTQQSSDLTSQNDRRAKEAKSTRGDADDLDKKLTAERKKRIDAESERDNAKSNVGLATKEAAKWKSDVAGQKEEISKVDDLIDTVKLQFEKELGRDVELDEIPQLFKKLEDDLKDVNRKLEETVTLREGSEKRVASTQEAYKDLVERKRKRAANMRANTLHGHVTGVNHDWGFAQIRIPSGMPVIDGTALIIKRGSSHVCELKASSVEGNTVIVDLDYKKMNGGLVIRPGDSVILAKPITN